jgi:peptidoglycan/LPS O-acetylase OafA/YrhL
MEGSSEKSGRLSGLDGLRAVSILSVIVFHLCWHIDTVSRVFFLRALAIRAALGVNVFFVISGFLITWLLVSEQVKTGGIDLVRFYQRRFLRILPPAFAYLLAVKSLAMLGIVAVTWMDVAKAAFFIRNIAHGGSLETVHFWSLAIEEQFYLIWPLMMVLISRRKQIPVTLLLVAVAPFWRWVIFHVYGLPPATNIWRTDLNYDLLLLGCLVAFGRHDSRFSSLLRGRWLQHPLAGYLAIVGSIAAAFIPGRYNGPVVAAIGPCLFAGCIAILINFVIEGRSNWLNRALDWPLLVGIGRISYSLYLWQQLFCFGDVDNHWMRRFPQNVALTFAMATLSYFLIELPSSRLRSRFKSTRARSTPLPEAETHVPVSS